MHVGLIKRSIVVLFIACGSLLLASHTQVTGAAAFENPVAVQSQNPSGGPQKLAEERFKNIQIFKGQPAANVMPAMMGFTKSLGVDCAFCHVQGAMDKDDKEHKKIARQMYHMVQIANKEIGEPRVSCYTCHRGHEEPPESAEPTHEQVMEMLKKADEDKRPAETAYKNIQALKGVNAGRVMVYMRLFTKALGVRCDFCHVQGAFDKDDNPHKTTARQMIRMVGTISKEIFNGTPTVNCWTCHQGQHEPPMTAPQDGAAKPEEKKPHQDMPTKPEDKKPPQ